MLRAVFISSGHGKTVYGATDPGTVGTYAGNKITERQITRDMGERVLRILAPKLPAGVLLQGVGVVTEASVLSKTNYINKVIRMNAFNPQDCFAVSIHVDSNVPTPGICGYWQSWKYNKGPELLGKILQSIHDYFGVMVKKGWPKPSKESRFKRLYIDNSLCAHVLVEMGHIGNDTTKTILMTQTERMAEAIAHGILEFLRKKYGIK